MERLAIETRKRTDFVLLTDRVQTEIVGRGWQQGCLTLFVPHTTAGITIQENADPEVMRDFETILEGLVPWEDRHYRHLEGNTAAHVKASLTGSSVQCLVEGGRLCLGRWQGLFFCEFDGPRTRELWMQFSGA